MAHKNLSNIAERNYQKLLSSNKSELGIFWMDEACSEIIHSKTVQEDDIDKTDNSQYSFLHSLEWSHRPPGIPGDYRDYPRGRIYYFDGHYRVELNVKRAPQLESYIRNYFSLPSDTIFSFGNW